MIAKINGKQYVVNDGGIITERRDEVFDDGNITIEIQDNNTPFQKEQLIELQRDNDTWLFYIQLDSITYNDVDNNVFAHRLLFSELTILLTKLKTPIMKFINSQGFTPKYNTFKDIALSVLKRTFPELNTRQTTYKFTQRLLDALERIPARDIETQAGSLFTTLKEIMIPIKGIPRLIDETTIDVTFPNEITDTIEFNNFNKSSYKKELGSVVSGSYVQTRGLNIVNEGENINSLTFTNPPGVLLSPRASGTVLDEDTFIYETVNPIQKVEQFIFKNQQNVDAAFFVVESKVYDSLPVLGFSTGTSNRYQQNCAVFNFGDTKVTGMGKVFDAAIPGSEKVVWKEMLRSAGYTGSFPSFRNLLVDAKITPIMNDLIIKVPKESIENIKIESGYEINQARNIISLDQIGKVLAVDVDKTGNIEFDYDVRVNASMDDIFELGSLNSLENSILAIRELEFYADNIVASYNLFEDFVALNEILDKRIEFQRQYPIPEQGLTDDRNIVLTDYVVATLDTSLQPLQSTYLTGLGFIKYLETFRGISGQAVDSVTLTAGEEELSTRVPVSSGGHDRGLNFYFGFNDSVFAGSNVITFGSGSQAVTTNNGVRYSDRDGSLSKISLQYGENITGNAVSEEVRAEGVPRVNPTELDENILIEVGNYIETGAGGTTLYGPTVTKNGIIQNPPGETSSPIGSIQLETSVSQVEFKFALVSISAEGVPVDTGNVLLESVDADGSTIYGQETYSDIGSVSPTGKVIPQSFTITIATSGSTFYYRLRSIDQDGKEAFWELSDARVSLAGNPFREVGNTYLDLDKDSGESMKINYVNLGVPYNTKEAREDLGEIIWGPAFFEQNALVGGFSNTTKVYTTTERYTKDEDLFVKGTQTSGTISTSVSSVDDSFVGTLTVANFTLANGSSWAIGDANGRLYVAVNPPKNGQATLKIVNFLSTHKRLGLDYPYLQ